MLTDFLDTHGQMIKLLHFKKLNLAKAKKFKSFHVLQYITNNSIYHQYFLNTDK